MCLAWTSHISPRAHNSPHTELMTVLAMWKFISGMSYHWLIWVLMGSHMCQLYLMSYQGPRLETWWDFICMMIAMMSHHHPIWSLMSSHNFLVTANLRTRSSPTSNSGGFVRLHENQWKITPLTKDRHVGGLPSVLGCLWCIILSLSFDNS